MNIIPFKHGFKLLFQIVFWVMLMGIAWSFNVWAEDKAGTFQVQKGVKVWEAKGKTLKTPPTKKLKGKTLPKNQKVTIQSEKDGYSLVQSEGSKQTFWVKTDEVKDVINPQSSVKAENPKAKSPQASRVRVNPIGIRPVVKRGNFKKYYEAALGSVPFVIKDPKDPEKKDFKTKKDLEQSGVTTLVQLRKALAEKKLQVFKDATTSIDPKNKTQKANQEAAIQDIKSLRKFSLVSLLAQDDKLTEKFLKDSKLKVQSVRDLERIPHETLKQTLLEVYPELKGDDKKGDKEEEELNSQVRSLQNRAKALRYLTDLMKLRKRQKMGRSQTKDTHESSAASGAFAKTGKYGMVSRSLKANATEKEGQPVCPGVKDLFAPNVYLLYVLDFFSTYFQSVHGQNATLDGLSKAFNQDFGQTICHDFHDPTKTWSYVKLTNQILENLIAGLSSDEATSDTLNLYLGEDWERDFKTRDANKDKWMHEIYSHFKKTDQYEDFKRDKLYEHLSVRERKNLPAFEEGILVEWFDRLVNEVGFTRKEFQLASVHPETEKTFLKEYNLIEEEATNEKKPWTKEDINLLKWDDLAINYKVILALKTFLGKYLGEKAKTSITKEWINDLGEIRGREFEKVYRGIKKDAQEKILKELIQGRLKIPENQLVVLKALSEGQINLQDEKQEQNLRGVLSAIFEEQTSLAKQQKLVLMDLIEDPIDEEAVIFLRNLFEGGSELTEEKLQVLPGQARACLDGGSNDEPNQNCWPGGVAEAGAISSQYVSNEHPKMQEMFRFYYGQLFPKKANDEQAKMAWVNKQIEQVENRKEKELHDEIQEEEDAAKAEGAEYNREEAKKKATDRIAQYLKADEGVEQELINMAQREFEQNLKKDEWSRKQEFEEAVANKTRKDWHQAIARAESGILERIRNNLIIIAMLKLLEKNKDASAYPKLEPVQGQKKGGKNFKKNFETLGKYLFVDLGISESKNLPPLSFSIERVHSFYQMVELEKDKKAQGSESVKPYVTSVSYQSDKKFREGTWGWLKSYGVWHAAMMVSSYPSHVLFPELRPNQTPQFESLLEQLDDGIDPQTLFNNFREEIVKLADLKFVSLVEIGKNKFIFAFSPSSKQIFYSVISPAKWIPWAPVPVELSWNEGQLIELENGIPFQIVYYARNIYFLGVGKKRKLDLEQFPNIKESFTPLYMTLALNETTLSSQKNLDNSEMEDSTGTAWAIIEGSRPIEFSVVERDRYFSPWKFALHSHGEFEGTKRLTATIIFREFLSSILVSNFTDNYSFASRNFVLKDGEAKAITPAEVDVAEEIFGDHDLMGGSINEFGKQMQDVHSGFLHGTHPSPALWKIQDQWYAGNYEHRAGQRIIIVNEQGEEQEHIVWEIEFPKGKCEEGKFVPESSNIVACTSDTLEHPFGLTDFFSPHKYFNTYKKGSEGSYLVQLKSGKQVTVTSIPNWATINEGLVLEGLRYRYPHGNISSLRPFFDKFSPNGLLLDTSLTAQDAATLYQDELNLYGPLALAASLGANEKYSEAVTWLRKALEYMESNASQSEKVTRKAVGLWLENPFNPYAFAELSRDIYFIHVKQELAATLTDWADHLFTMDIGESVNRARKLYEEADHVLGELQASESSVSSEKDQGQSTGYGIRIGSHGYEFYWDQNVGRTVFEPDYSTFIGASQTSADTPKVPWYWQNFAEDSQEEDVVLSEVPGDDPFSGMDVVDLVGPLPDLLDGPSLQESPMIVLLRWRVNSGLEKIRSHLNFAGFPRQLQPYATPVDPEKLVRAAAAGDLDFEQFIPNGPPPIYRFSFLLDRAKYLVSVAQQFQGSMLAALEKFDAESYTLLKARQDSQLAKSQLVLQSLRMTEAWHGLKRAEVQLERMEFQGDHYSELLAKGISKLERAAIYLNGVAATHFAGAAVANGIAWQWGAMMNSAGQALATTSQVLSTKAYWNRREQDWKFQRDLSNFDIEVARLGIDLAGDRLNIVGQEKEIAQLALDNTNDTIEFLGAKFSNTDLYTWMSKQLRKLYRHQLSMAIGTASAAQDALEFERQTSLDFIGHDYWDEERKGLLGSERLLKDLDEMEQFRLGTAQRRREIEKTISLATKAPLAFQRFKETGVLEFSTLPDWFEADFPGHYLRLIRDVRVSMLALIQPVEGIHATLSNDGVSWVMAGPPFEEPTPILRQPEAIALDRANQATGLFELQPSDPMLLPFEGSGVAATWRLELPKGANRFDFNSIADVHFTMRYTALEDRIYRKKILEEKLGQDEEGYVSAANVRVFSVRSEFPDQWYQFTHALPGQDGSKVAFPHKFKCEKFAEQKKSLPPHTMVLPVTERDFVPHEQRRRITGVMALLQVKQDEPSEEKQYLPLALTFIPKSTSSTCLIGERQEMMRLSPFDTSEKMDFMPPYGDWVFQLNVKDTSNTYDLSKIQDLILGIEYKAKVHYPQ